MKISNLITKPYYHTPVWMTILLDGFVKLNLVQMLKTTGQESGIFSFRARYGEERGREEILYVWNATPEQVYTHLQHDLGTDVHMLVSMVEDYSRERGGREETKVYSGLIQLIVARAAELFTTEKPNETLIINGNFSMIGRLPQNGRIRINGTVERVEGSVGQLLEVASERCPQLPRLVTAQLVEKKVWHIQKTEPWHEAPITGFYLKFRGLEDGSAGGQ